MVDNLLEEVHPSLAKKGRSAMFCSMGHVAFVPPSTGAGKRCKTRGQYRCDRNPPKGKMLLLILFVEGKNDAGRPETLSMFLRC